LDKLRIILVWATGLTLDYNRTQFHRIASKYINPTSDPTKSLNLPVAIALSEEFPETLDIVVPPSLSFKIAAGIKLSILIIQLKRFKPDRQRKSRPLQVY
jgi:hypothetical protein